MANTPVKTSFAGTGKIARLTAIGTVCCILLSLLISYFLLLSSVLTPFGQIVTLAVLLPMVIALPLLVMVGYQRNQLGAVRRELTRSVTYDPLTSCLRGPVFSSLIDRRKALSPGAEKRGAFIIIHIGDLQTIQRDYGLDWADETLRTIGEVIRSSVRETDIVGRIDPADFGVFLPGATEEDARNVGDRVSKQIASARIVTGDDRQNLDVRIAGIVFQRELLFDEMFRATQDLLPKRPSAKVVLSEWPRTPRSQPGWTN